MSGSATLGTKIKVTPEAVCIAVLEAVACAGVGDWGRAAVWLRLADEAAEAQA